VIVALAIVGRGPADGVPGGPHVVVAPASGRLVDDPADMLALDGSAVGDLSGASASPTLRSDWPAAIGRSQRRASGEHQNRFTIDDVHSTGPASDGTPQRGRRLGGITSYLTDPYER